MRESPCLWLLDEAKQTMWVQPETLQFKFCIQDTGPRSASCTFLKFLFSTAQLSSDGAPANYLLIEEKWTQASWFSFVWVFTSIYHFAPSYTNGIITLVDGKYLHFYKEVRFSYTEGNNTHLILGNIYDGTQKRH